MKKQLTIELLQKEARQFCKTESTIKYSELYGISDGKSIGTFVEHRFKKLLSDNYVTDISSSALGIDLPGENILTDIKVTSIRQPQSSCPFQDARQKIYGLGYNILLFVYEKIDNHSDNTSTIKYVDCSFISKECTADYTSTFRLREMLNDNANVADIIGYLTDKNIPGDEITLTILANEILTNKPLQGYLTISNALQWRLQYQRIVNISENISGIIKLYSKKSD